MSPETSFLPPKPIVGILNPNFGFVPSTSISADPSAEMPPDKSAPPDISASPDTSIFADGRSALTSMSPETSFLPPKPIVGILNPNSGFLASASNPSDSMATPLEISPPVSSIDTSPIGL